jgi:hypothetical protein
MAEQEQQKQEPVYLFISQSCQHCIDIIKQIQQKDILAKLVQVVAVENAPKLPPGVTKVPSILVNYGELDASPTYTNSSGFESEGFSYLGSDGGGDGGTDSFSFLGASNGMEGADMSQADAAYKQEQGQKQKGNGAESMDNITAQRNQDMNQMQGGRR